MRKPRKSALKSLGLPHLFSLLLLFFRAHAFQQRLRRAPLFLKDLSAQQLGYQSTRPHLPTVMKSVDVEDATPIILAFNFIQDTRDFVQAFLSSLPLKILLASLGALLSGAAVAPFKKAIESGRQNRDAGSTIDFTVLSVCVAIDLIGDTSFLLPGVGEVEDLIWAPLSSLIVFRIFGSETLATVNFVKELLPVSDILPLATIAWLLENIYSDSDIAKLLALDRNHRDIDSDWSNQEDR